MTVLTAARLREVLDYDPATGVFRWRAASHPNSRVNVGCVAGYIESNGYRRIAIDRRRYLAGRLVWLNVAGEWPVGQIDHKNGIRDDNRFDNLRDVTCSKNSQNLRQAHSDSKTGLLGVHQHRGKFRADIQVDGKKRHLGYFATAEAAHAIYVEAKRRLHPTCTI